MKRIVFTAVAILLTVQVPTGVHAQSAPAQKSVASAIGVYVFPAAGQNASTQSQDEAQCYSWAVQNTGIDPSQVAQQSQQAAAAPPPPSGAAPGSGARGAARGAAGGALIGGIAGDAGKGAAIGAATGAVAGRSRSRRAQDQAQAQQAQSVQSGGAAQMDTFKKAFSACLEGKKYTVKF
jgi:Glycine-zipper domain